MSENTNISIYLCKGVLAYKYFPDTFACKVIEITYNCSNQVSVKFPFQNDSEHFDYALEQRDLDCLLTLLYSINSISQPSNDECAFSGSRNWSEHAILLLKNQHVLWIFWISYYPIPIRCSCSPNNVSVCINLTWRRDWLWKILELSRLWVDRRCAPMRILFQRMHLAPAILCQIHS